MFYTWDREKNVCLVFIMFFFFWFIHERGGRDTEKYSHRRRIWRNRCHLQPSSRRRSNSRKQVSGWPSFEIYGMFNKESGGMWRLSREGTGSAKVVIIYCFFSRAKAGEWRTAGPSKERPPHARPNATMCAWYSCRATITPSTQECLCAHF